MEWDQAENKQVEHEICSICKKDLWCVSSIGTAENSVFDFQHRNVCNFCFDIAAGERCCIEESETNEDCIGCPHKEAGKLL